MELKAENRKTVDRVTKVRFKAGITRSGSKINIIYLHFMNTIYQLTGTVSMKENIVSQASEEIEILKRKVRFVNCIHKM
jgi:hypothetical protein